MPLPPLTRPLLAGLAAWEAAAAAGRWPAGIALPPLVVGVAYTRPYGTTGSRS